METSRLLQQGVAVVVGGVGRVAPGDRRALLDEQSANVMSVGVDDEAQGPAELVEVGCVHGQPHRSAPHKLGKAAVASSDQHSSDSGALMPISRTLIDVVPLATSIVSPSITSVTIHGSSGGNGGAVAEAVAPSSATTVRATPHHHRGVLSVIGRLSATNVVTGAKEFRNPH